jgi:hypothetical protein
MSEESFERPANYDEVSPNFTQAVLMQNERFLVAMQCALIEAHNKGDRAGLRWIFNTLEGPGLTPDVHPDAQAYFDLHAPSIEACAWDAKRSVSLAQLTETQRKDLLAAAFYIAARPEDGATFTPEHRERVLTLLSELAGEPVGVGK